MRAGLIGPRQDLAAVPWRSAAGTSVGSSARGQQIVVDQRCEYLYIRGVGNAPKPLLFCGNSHEALLKLPHDARRGAGFALYRVQMGREPDDWKPIQTVGSGVGEIRLRDETGAFRVFYIAKFPEAVYVLHCFQKKSQQTAAKDIALGRKRLNILLEERNQ